MIAFPTALADDDLHGDDPEQSIPLPTHDEEQAMTEAPLPETLPVLALRNTVLFPGVVLPITVGRDASLRLVRDAYAGDRLVAVVAQKRSDVETPEPKDLYGAGTAATILKLIKMPDGSVSIVIQGKRRIDVDDVHADRPVPPRPVTAVDEEAAEADDAAELSARIRQIKELAVQIVNLSPNLPSEAAYAIQNIESPRFLVHFITSNLQIEVEKKQELLETRPLLDRAQLVLGYLEQEIRVLEISEEIRSKVKTDVDQQQREFFLRQQLKTIQDELGETEGSSADTAELRTKLDDKRDDLPETVVETVEKELTKLARTNPASPEYSVVRNYAETILDLPWNHVSDDLIDIARAAAVLDEDHYGLGDVKKRILEYLAVLKLKGDLKAPILCFYGPPGRRQDEPRQEHRAGRRARVPAHLARRRPRRGRDPRPPADLHRRAPGPRHPGPEARRDVQPGLHAGRDRQARLGLPRRPGLGPPRGARPGAERHVQRPLPRAGLRPLAGHVYRDGQLARHDPRAACATAWRSSRSTATRRPRSSRSRRRTSSRGSSSATACVEAQFSITDDALRLLVEGYTRESGVRQLERTIGSVVRNVAKSVAMGEASDGEITVDNVDEALGARKFYNDVAERTEVPGVATGLAWTPVGGDILFIEASLNRGTGRMTITGKLGEVMRESAQAASQLGAGARRASSASPARRSRTSTCTCTSRPARSPKTARARALR